MAKLAPDKAVLDLWKSKYPEASVIFLAGSVIRGEGTDFSDLDLVVVFDELENAWRDSYHYGGWPVEAFVHDPQSLRYFFEEVDAKSGFPSLPQMVVEGIALPEETGFSKGLKEMAQAVLDLGPPAWSQGKIDRERYGITDLIDDLRDPRDKNETFAAGIRLYDALADFHLRTQGKWSARGKTIPRVLKKSVPSFADKFLSGFEILFSEGDSSSVVKLAEDILKPYGGFLFEGHRLDAPKDWKK